MQDPTEPFADQAAMVHEPRVERASGPTLSEDLQRTLDDAKALLAAEIALQKARAAYAGKQAASIALLGLVALAFAFCALMALVFGTVLALVPLLTAWGATAAVAGALLLVAVVAGLTAAARARRTARVVADPRDAA